MANANAQAVSEQELRALETRVEELIRACAHRKYENRMLRREDFADDQKDAGELGAGHTVTALYEVVPVAAGENNSHIEQSKYQETRVSESARRSNELMTIRFRYKRPDGQKSMLIEKPVIDEQIALNKTSDNFRFSAAVAGFGMLLRDSKFSGTATFSEMRKLAAGAKGKDIYGYRTEFLTLVEKCDLIVASR